MADWMKQNNGYQPLPTVEMSSRVMERRQQPTGHNPNSPGRRLPSQRTGNTKSPGRSASMVADYKERAEADLDEVQFAAPMFFTLEDQPAVVRLMRVGKADSSCSVRWCTEDGSAKAGDKYEAAEGVLDFAPGELSKQVSIKIFSSSTFNTDLEFGVHLQVVNKCKLGQLTVARVMILDNDVFPNDSFRDLVADQNEDSLRTQGVALIMSYMKLAMMSVKGVWWKALLTVLWDQLENVYDICMIFLRIYLIDVVLHPEKGGDDLLMKGQPKATALLLAAMYIVPCFVLLIVERLKRGPWYMGDDLKDNLKVNVFRKYLNYTDEARREAPMHVLQAAMSADIPDLVENGFLGMFEVVQYLGKILSTGYVVVTANPKNILPVAAYPIIILCFTICRMSKANQVQDDIDEAEDGTLKCVTDAAQNIDLICEYRQRPFAVHLFEKALKTLGEAEYSMRLFTFQQEQLVPLLTNCVVALYICVGSWQVISGQSTIGEFVATLNIFQNLGAKFEKIYSRARTWLTAAGPVVAVTYLLNLPTTSEVRKAKAERRCDETRERLRNLDASQGPPQGPKKAQNSHAHFYDNLPIHIKNVSYGSTRSLQSMNLEASQGQFTLVTGAHATGKASLMNLIVDVAIPEKGTIFVPEHLRCISVQHSPDLLEELSLWRNVCFGCKAPDLNRVIRICERLGMERRWLDIIREDAAREETEEEPDLSWCNYLSVSEKRKVHMARAFVYDPELLVLHRPMNQLDLSEINMFRNAMREYVDNRGLEKDPQTAKCRRARSLFVTCAEVGGLVDSAQRCHRSAEMELAKAADVIWTLNVDGPVEVTPGGHAAKPKTPPTSVPGKIQASDAPVKSGGG
eukprot:TRINITY_DN27339_c0_g1_i1.p1 TRINITY_DN27339_c0_g1~~TRINITY_DN27339_c0_g1_i1.p1  ORF type:complete len:856 (+),score=144.83 TRINITY_DN27339_c0_g1_i1:67-2634(+)